MSVSRIFAVVTVVRSSGALNWIVTAVLVGTPVLLAAGLMNVTPGAVGLALCTVNPAFTSRISDAPVCTRTSRAPSVAPAAIVSVAFAVVALVTVTNPKSPCAPPLTEIPAPNRACVVPFTKFVNSPVIDTGTVEFGTPTFGLMTVIFGSPGRTVNAPILETTSAPVVTVTVRGPAGAPIVTVTGTWICVGPFTVTVPAVSPLLLNDTVDVPAWKCVNDPVIVSVCMLPWAPLVGVTVSSDGTPASTVNTPRP